MDLIYQKIENLIAKIRTRASDEEAIDLQKTFSSSGIDTLPIIIKILELETGFPDSRISSLKGNKYHELEFFTVNHDSTNTPDKSLFQRLDYTQTDIGSTLLKSIILEPIHTNEDILKIIQNRQNVIQELIDNSTSELDSLRARIKSIGIIERDMLALYLEDTPEMLEVYKIIFFDMGPFKYLNYHSGFLKIFYYFMIIFSPIYGMVAPFIFIFAPFLFLKYIMKIPIPLNAFWTMMKKMLFGNSGFFSILDKLLNSTIGDNLQSSLNGNGGFSIKGVVFWLAKMLIMIINSNLGSWGYIAFIVISYLYGIYNSLQVSITYNKVINMFHSRMKIVAEWLRECKKMLDAQICFHSQELAPILKQVNNTIQCELVRNLLYSSEFDNNANVGLISDKGIIIKTFKMFLDTKTSGQNIIKPFAQYMGYVDMFSAIATWLREGLGKDKCLVQFNLDSKTPFIHGKDIWNICCSKPVYNDVLLGSSIDLQEEIQKDNTEPSNTTDPTSNTTDPTSNTTDPTSNTTDTPSNTTDPTSNTTDPTSNTTDPTSNTTDPTSNENKSEIDKELKEKQQYNNIIITGPNGSGKSTYIKSIAECLILAQSIGIAPAKEFHCTPFKHISTYLNIPDCQGKESLFQAEMNRCYNQLQMLENAENQGEFSFNIMDEIFVSTNYQEGMSGAYAIINQLCRLKNCVNIITTHFDKLALLDKLQVDKRFFDINILEDGSITRDYKIREGVSKKHMALCLLRNRGFSKEILDDAENFYKTLQTESTQQRTE